MSDTELTEPEADRLRQLLHRAADSLDVTVPDHVELQPTRTRPGPGRWLAAAAVLVVAAVGAAWWVSGDSEGQRIDTGPAEPSITVAPRVLEESDIWRLPEDLDGYRVVGAQDGGSFDTSSADTPGVLAVDDPDDPRRWLLVQAYDEISEAPEGSRQVELSDEVTATLIPTEGSTWFQLSGASGGGIGASGSALGIDEEELIDLLTEHLGSSDALTSASSPTAPMEAMLDDAGFGDDRLVWQGNGDGSPGCCNQQLEVTLMGDDNTEVVILLNGTNAPAWAQAIQLRMTAEVLSMQSLADPQGTMSTNPRPDLGPNVLEVGTSPPGLQPLRTLTVITDDGVAITAGPTFRTADPASAPLSEEAQLRIINSLRAMTEDEFRARLAELGVEFMEPETAEMFVTGTPGGPVTPLPGGPDD